MHVHVTPSWPCDMWLRLPAAEGEQEKGSEAVVLDPAAPLAGPPLLVDISPPAVGLVLAGAVPVGVQLVPGVWGEDVVDVLDPVVAPDGAVDAVPAQGLEGVVDVGQGDPAAAVELAEQALVGKVEVAGVAIHVVDDLGEDLCAGVDDLQAAVHVAEVGHGRVGPLVLGGVRVGVLRGEGAVGGDPVLGVVGLAQRVADAGMAGGEDALGAGPPSGGGGPVVEGHGHELVHVLQDQHVAVELDDAVVLGEAEGGELAPAVVEARVVAVVAGGLGGQQVLDLLVRDAAGVQGGEALGREGVGVEGHQRVCRLVLLERVVQGEQAREVVRVCDEGGPDWGVHSERGSRRDEGGMFIYVRAGSPLLESTALLPSAIFKLMSEGGRMR